MEKKNKEEKSSDLIAFADFEFRGKSYVKGDVFIPAPDLTADPNMDEFRRISRKRGGVSRGKVYYCEIPAKNKGDDPEIYRIILPVE